MKYSKKQITKAGNTLISSDADTLERGMASALVDKWRVLHIVPLQKLNEQLEALFTSEGLNYSFCSQRMKRMTSILDKLRNNQENQMGLGNLDDIGGVRFVFHNIEDVQRADAILQNFAPQNFTLKRVKNYIERVKTSGYRSIHYIYEYQTDEADYDGLKVELQIRTKLQHSWAMAVETASMISQTSLKANIDDGSVWRQFFVLISAIFSIKENCPKIAAYSEATLTELCNEYFKYENRHKLLTQLSALSVVTENKKGSANDSFYLLMLDIAERKVRIATYDEHSADEAAGAFTATERSIANNDNEVALLVSVNKMNEIREAYPSYFLDVQQFYKVVEEFYKNCNLQ